MSEIKKRIAAGAVVLALGGLGGVAWANNPAAQHGSPAAIVSTNHGGSTTTRTVTTGTSGAVATPAVNTQTLPSTVFNGGRRDD